MRTMLIIVALIAVFVSEPLRAQENQCAVELVVLGAGQDAGAPQIGNHDDPGWQDNTQRLLATSLALIDHRAGDHYLFEATPDVREQLYNLDQHSPFQLNGPQDLSGVFLTHAHIGHYAGLMFFGHESAGAQDVVVHTMPRMADYLRNNGPWSQLVSLNNIALNNLRANRTIILTQDIKITALPVPHRDEYSETVGFLIETERHSALFLPDIDHWDLWRDKMGQDIRTIIDDVDFAFLDATFFDDHELPGRDMSKIPHPRVIKTMEALDTLATQKKKGVYFIHYNHTNPIRDPNSQASHHVLDKNFNIARRGMNLCLQ